MDFIQPRPLYVHRLAYFAKARHLMEGKHLLTRDVRQQLLASLHPFHNGGQIALCPSVVTQHCWRLDNTVWEAERLQTWLNFATDNFIERLPKTISHVNPFEEPTRYYLQCWDIILSLDVPTSSLPTAIELLQSAVSSVLEPHLSHTLVWLGKLKQQHSTAYYGVIRLEGHMQFWGKMPSQNKISVRIMRSFIRDVVNFNLQGVFQQEPSLGAFMVEGGVWKVSLPAETLLVLSDVPCEFSVEVLLRLFAASEAEAIPMAERISYSLQESLAVSNANGLNPPIFKVVRTMMAKPEYQLVLSQPWELNCQVERASCYATSNPYRVVFPIGFYPCDGLETSVVPRHFNRKCRLLLDRISKMSVNVNASFSRGLGCRFVESEVQEDRLPKDLEGDHLGRCSPGQIRHKLYLAQCTLYIHAPTLSQAAEVGLAWRQRVLEWAEGFLARSSWQEMGLIIGSFPPLSTWQQIVSPCEEADRWVTSL